MARQLTVPPEIVSGIGKIADEKKIPKAQLLKDLTTIMKTDAVISKLKDDAQRIQAAWGVLASSYVSFGGATKEILIQPLSVGAVRTTAKSMVADILALTIIDDEDPVFSKYTAWGDQAKVLETLKLDTCYKLTAQLTKTKLGVSGKVDNESIIMEVERELMNEAKFFKELFADPNRRCTIADAPNNVVGIREDLDIRVIEGTVVSVAPTRAGTGAVFNIIDNTFTSSDRMNGFTVYANLDQLKGGIGSKGYFTGKIGLRDKTAETPEAIMRNGLFSPEIATEYIGE